MKHIKRLHASSLVEVVISIAIFGLSFSATGAMLMHLIYQIHDLERVLQSDIDSYAAYELKYSDDKS